MIALITGHLKQTSSISKVVKRMWGGTGGEWFNTLSLLRGQVLTWAGTGDLILPYTERWIRRPPTENDDDWLEYMERLGIYVFPKCVASIWNMLDYTSTLTT